MAGSINHCLVDVEGKPGQFEYRGVALLENMGDMAEGVEEMMFVIGALSDGYTADRFRAAKDRYYQCLRGEEPWPAWFSNGVKGR